MIVLFSTLLALAFPTLEGVLLLRALEGGMPVLYRPERIAAGFLVGLSFCAYVLFWAVLFGLPLTFWGFLAVHVVLVVALSFLLWWRLQVSHSGLRASGPRTADSRFQISKKDLSPGIRNLPLSPVLPLPSLRALKQSLPPWALFVGTWMILWTLLKVGAGAYDLLSVPAYFDDTYANWNMRAKAFYVSEDLLLDLPREHEMFFGGRVPSYPLTIYFAKVWLAMMAGDWEEGVVNSIHIVWFLVLLGLLFCSLLRTLRHEGERNAFVWAAAGIYALASLPLVLVHGTNPYSDIAMAAYLFLPLSALFQWSRESDPLRQRSWFLLLCVSAAAMLFVKSEALLLFFPPLMLLFLFAWYREEYGKPGAWRAPATYAGTVALVAAPWTLFKAFHALEFGNAQTVSGFTLTVNEGVPGAIGSDLLYTGSYLLFFPLFLLLCVLTLRWPDRTGSPLRMVLAFLLIVFLGQFLIYYLTPLGPEAIRHTGFGRGMVQLLPAFVFVAVVLLSRLFRCDPYPTGSSGESLPG